jgi:uncharacterized protein YndB with AHSA1/START domain
VQIRRPPCLGLDRGRPNRISFTWHVGRHQDTAQLIELTFDPSEHGTTRVTLTDSGWERLDDKASDARARYNEGWNEVLARFAKTGETWVPETGTGGTENR